MTCLVVGAGPAGCAAAAAISACGVEVVVLERGRRGKDKPCGDAFLPDAVDQLRRLGVSADATDAVVRPFDGVDLWEGDRRLWRVGLPSPGWVAPRAIIDQLLRDRVAESATVAYDQVVRSLERREGRWLVSVGSTAGSHRGEVNTLRYDAIVLATGSATRLAQSVGLTSHADIGTSATVYAHRAEAGMDDPRLLRCQTSIDFHFGVADFSGYAWVFPVDDLTVNLGVCSLGATRRPLANLLSSFAADRGWTPFGRVRTGAAPMWTGSQTTWHDDRGIAVCGDAAGLVDPLSGEGIGVALESGSLAGAAIAGHLAGGADALSGYSAELRRRADERMALSPQRRVWSTLVSA